MKLSHYAAAATTAALELKNKNENKSIVIKYLFLKNKNPSWQLNPFIIHSYDDENNGIINRE